MSEIISMSDEAPVLIVGTGAMACLFAARFTAAGVPVMMLGTWKEGLAALQESGVSVVEGTQTVTYPVHGTDDSDACNGARFAIVLVKSWQTERAARQLAGCLAGDGLALTLQNGMGNYETLAEALGAHRVALGTTTAGAWMEIPGRVHPAGEGIVTLGSHPYVALLSDLLRKAGFAVEIVDDIETIQWGKLLISAAINPLSALLRVPNGELLRRRSARGLMAAVAREAASTAIALGISLPYSDPVAAAETVAGTTATNLSSMLQDVKRGAPTEIDAICGAIVKTAERAGVPAPINWTLWQLMKGLSEA